MLADRDLEPEEASRPYQSSRLFQAVDNVKAAHEIQRANAIATLVYDAMRAAVDVHANVHRLQISGRDQHQNSVEYAYAAMGERISADDLTTYDELRLVRHRVVEYPPIGGFIAPSLDEAARYLAAANRIATAIQRWWNEAAQ